MDQIQQVIGDIEHKHKQELARLQTRHEQQLREQAARFEARILALRTASGLEHERRIQEAAFDEKVFSQLCSWVKTDYDPAKHPPNVHTLVQALTIEPEDEPSDDNTNPHQVSYHRMAAFRDFIVESFQVIGAAVVRQQDGFLSQEAEFELEELHAQNEDLQREYDMAESKVAELKTEVYSKQSKVYTLLSVLTRLTQHMEKSEKESLLRFLESFESSEQQHEIRNSSGSGGGSVAGRKRKVEESTGEIGRNVRVRVEDEKSDLQDS